MKRLCTLLLILMVAFSLVACSKDAGGGNEDEKISSSSGEKMPSSGGQKEEKTTEAEEESKNITPVESISAKNWQQVIKENFELDLQLPDGWEIKEAKYDAGTHLSFNCDADEQAVAEYYDSIFEQMKGIGVVRITEHGGEKTYNSYSEAGSDTTGFSFAMNSEWSKSLYIDFDNRPAIGEVGLFILSEGDWSAPTGNHGYQKLEAYTGMEGVPAPDSYVISRSSRYNEDGIEMYFYNEAGEVATADIDAYAAKIYELCGKAADGGKCFWYNENDKKIAKEYSTVADAKKSDSQYAWFYTVDDEYVFIRIKLYTDTSCIALEALPSAL